MAPTLLAPGFSLREGRPDEIETICHIAMLAIKPDPLFHRAMGACEPEALLKWFVDTLGWRWAAPDVSTYVIVEDATGKIVAWTGLQFPWKYRPLPEEVKVKVLAEGMPPLLKEMHPEAMAEFFATLNCTLPYGGTMVHPDYQKRGFGTVLTRRCNAIMDKTGDRTLLSARPTSLKMFLDQGFKSLALIDSHLERWGDDTAWNKTAILLREPPS